MQVAIGARPSVRQVALVVVLLNLTLGFSACDGTDDRKPQQVTIGLITNNPNGLRNIEGFKDGLAAFGFVPGDTVTYMFDGVPVKQEELESAIRKMVDAQVDLIFTAGTPTGVAAHRVTAGTGIPVVFGVIADPVAAGVVRDLARPGGNMTGVKLSQNHGRRLELLLEASPGTRKILVPYNPEDAAPVSALREIEALTAALGIELVKGEVRNDRELTEFVRNVPENVDAVFLLPDSTVNSRLADVLAVAKARKLPVSGPSTAQVEEGALMTYGFVHHAAGRQAARIAAQVINGGRPGELPVETAEFFLAVNLGAAEAIGLEIPRSILDVADIVIRRDAR